MLPGGSLWLKYAIYLIIGYKHRSDYLRLRLSRAAAPPTMEMIPGNRNADRTGCGNGIGVGCGFGGGFSGRCGARRCRRG